MGILELKINAEWTHKMRTLIVMLLCSVTTAKAETVLHFDGPVTVTIKTSNPAPLYVPSVEATVLYYVEQAAKKRGETVEQFCRRYSERMSCAQAGIVRSAPPAGDIVVNTALQLWKGFNFTK